MPVESAVHETRLRSGVLRVTTHAAELPLEELCGFGTRRSLRRGFVFVSKVLGKHWPVRPCVFQDCCDRLADRLTDLEGPAVLVAMAETATGLGHGVFESWLRQTARNDLLFLHGTRYALARPPALTFEEAHSHATRHWLYEPSDPDDRRLFNSARTLVIVDDEMSTGATAANLAAAYRRHNPELRCVVFVCLTDWLDDASRAAVTTRVGVSTQFVNLLRGTFSFEPAPAFEPGPLPQVTGDDHDKSFCLPVNFGRLGLREELRLNEPALIAGADLSPGSRLLVLGTGEFHYPPFRLARWFEQQGWDVSFQSTTRSPLLVDGHLQSVLEFIDNYHEGIPNYLYNVADRHYDQVLIGYETDPLPTDHRLSEMLAAKPIHFGRT
ncbi:MAG: phosphoribosyltransferase domain-containing protein [Planctomycetaceae bacterium]